MSSNSNFFKITRNFKIFKRVYLWYNVYIRNFRYHFINSHKNSQFGEEKLILKNFKKNFIGTFLDIGCFHPTRNNNTYKMYKMGWRGINIDLNPLSIDLFDLARPMDINICAAISNKNSFTDLFFVGDLDTKNTIEKNQKKFLKKYFSITKFDSKKKRIKTKKLSDILKKYNYLDIDFMNIDIEGHELKVLESIDFNKFNIKLICIEINDYYNKWSKINNKKIFSFLYKKGYSLKGKTSVNYIFKKK